MQRDMKIVEVDARAIDVGYFNVKYTTGRKSFESKSLISAHMFPSLAPRQASNKRTTSAVEIASDGCVVEIEGISYFVGRDAIFHSSGKDPRKVLPEYSMSKKYTALMRGALYYMAKDAGAAQELVIDHLVLGLPMNNYGEMAEALEERARGEHLVNSPGREGSMLRITVNRASVMPQPRGSLFNFGVENPGFTSKPAWSLVVDAGGGTLDWFLSHGKTPNWERSGAYPSSMLACSYAVADMIDPDWKERFDIVQQIDEAIRRRAATFTVGAREFDMRKYQSAVDEVLHESVQAMLAKVEDTDNLSTILMTGGGATVYHDFIAKNYPKLRRSMVLEPDPIFSNVRGFQIAAELYHPRKTDQIR